MNADYMVQSIPYVHNDLLADVPGMNYDLYVELEARVARALYLYDARNVIKNGDFTQGLLGWQAAGNVEIQQKDRTSVLVLSNWSAGVSQNVRVQYNYGYVLRVIAKKEGTGKGHVTVMDCEGNHIAIKLSSYNINYSRGCFFFIKAMRREFKDLHTK